MKKLLTWFSVLILVATGVGVWYVRASVTHKPPFRAVAIERGSLAATISATGTIEPEEVVDIGAQVAGMIKNFGRDPRDSSKPVDYGTPVEEGTVLAQIDDAIYKSQVEQAQATLKKAEADLLQMQAKLHQTGRDWDRAKKLNTTRGVISDLDYDTAQASYESAESALDVGKATVALAKAALNQAEINLGYCTIRSPVKGVIVDRRVNVGQTVVASLNAPSLFLIAKDLTRLQIWASVNEADIGQIHTGQAVGFTVDAYPDEVFQGEVFQIRLNASMNQNVVTYTVVVNTDNSSYKLLPYLTTNLLFQVTQHENVLMAPNSALRWKPNLEQVAPDARSAYVKNVDRDPAASEKGQHQRGTVWVVEGDFVRPVVVKLGLTDGTRTEIAGKGLDAGTALVTGIAAEGSTESTSSNPFTPQLFNGKKSS